MTQELIFDRNLLLKRRSNKASILHKYDFIIKHSLENIKDKLNEISREFPVILNLGCRNGYASEFLKTRKGTVKLIETDISYELLQQSIHDIKLVVDEEYLPFEENQFDLIISLLNLHQVNDLPGCLVQLKRILKPNGVLIATMFGENNLIDLRESLMQIELELLGGVSPRTIPYVEIKQLGGLLQRVGFNMPVIDKDCLNVEYENPMNLLHDLQNMAESNIMLNRNKKYVGKEFWKKFAQNKDIIAKFEILNFTAVKP